MNNNTPKKDNTAPTLEIEILIGDFLRGVKKFGWVALALAVLLGGFQFYRSYVRFSPEYTVTATFTVHTENKVLSGDNGVSAYSFYYDRETADQLESVFPHIISNPILRQKVCDDLDVESMPASVTAACVKGTNMITLTSKGDDSQLAYDTLLSVIDNYSSVAEYIIGRTKLVMINEPVVPEKPSNANAWISDVFYAILIGFVLGLVWILVYAMLRKTIISKSDIQGILNQHCVGVLPQDVFKKYRREISKHLVLTNPLIGYEFLESLRLLRSSVQTSLGDDKVLMLTSTAPNEGKTVVTVNLAAAFTQEEKSVLVIDADLRNSGLQTMLNEGRFERQILTENEFFKIEHIEKLDFELLSFKPVIDSVQKIVRTANIKDLLAALKTEFDIVIIDTPPCGMISDATIIANSADAVVYVVRQDAVLQSNIRAGISSLLETETNFLGCILNGASSGFGSYGYYKYYRGGYSYKYGGYKKYGYSSNKKK